MEWKYESEKELQNALSSYFSAYQNISFTQLYHNKSLGGSHIACQVNYKHIPIEQCVVQAHFTKENALQFLQHNVPNIEEWNQFPILLSNTENASWLYTANDFYFSQKQFIQNEETDNYALHFSANNQLLFINDLKYHNDTTAYVKAFLPDPLSSAHQNYGGTYQDTYTKDTSAVLIQNINNTGSPLTISSSNYTYRGNTFNVQTETYTHSFSAPTLQQVFDKIYIGSNGVVLSYVTALTDNINTYTTRIIFEDYNYISLNNQLFWGMVPLQYNAGTFSLINDAFEIAEFSAPVYNAITSNTDTFSFNRNQIAFEDVNAFFHLNNFKTYWESLGFANLATQRIQIDTHGNGGADNSFFTPTNPPRLVFGQGGVDDAEDADVLVHEYGHAISHFAAPNTNIGEQRRALDEGFGDYLATTYSLQYSNYKPYDVFSWDGHNEYWAGRVSNANKTAQDISSTQNIYYNGEIWSSVLVDLRNELGAIIADKLAIQVMYYNISNTTIPMAAMNLFEADTALFGGAYTCQIFDVLQAKGFVYGTCADFYSGVNSLNKKGNIELINTLGFAQNEEDFVIHISDHFSNAHYTLYNVLGEKIKEEKIETNNTAVSGKNLSAGIYYLLVELNHANYSFTLLKQ
ncbi:MAG: M36 family metallopeptidase [Chitinophagales bacterium]|nr:M36 family metallopeptidase [Chitinophagales bacterium]